MSASQREPGQGAARESAGEAAAAAGAPVDIDTCAQEPIRIPGGVQPHGALAVVAPDDLRVLQVSANIQAFTGLPIVTGEPLASGTGEALAEELNAWLRGDAFAFLRTLTLGGAAMQVSAHRSAQGVIVEFERPPASEGETLEAVYPRLRAFVETVGEARSVRQIGALAAREIREMTGFNRVMLYALEDEGEGEVVCEDSDGVLPSYVGLRFPASDIPAQARDLYRLNRLRLIPDAGYAPAPIEPPTNPLNGRPLDLSLAALRSVSPIHLEYMRNMGTWASMSISVLVDGVLWGLFTCHNAEPRLVNAQIRTACDFIGQIVSLQIGDRERAERAARRIEAKRVESELLARLTQASTLAEGVAANEAAWLRLVQADGVVLVLDDAVVAHGSTPSEPEARELAAWIKRRGGKDVFATDSLAALWPPAEAFGAVASGVLAICISQLHPSYIMWFRQEVVRTVSWAGDPRKEPATSGRLHPRVSFDVWKQRVRLKSARWTEGELETAREFRHAIVGVVLRRAEERAALSEELQRSNAELEAFSYSVSHDLRAPFRHIAGYAELLSARETTLDETSRRYLASIVEAAHAAGQLVDDLLGFSQLGRTRLSRGKVDMNKLVAEVRRSLEGEVGDRAVEWAVGPLPPACGDGALLRQVWANLLGNAVKYTRGRAPSSIRIEGRRDEAGAVHYTVADNGVGFDNAYVGKLFGVFQRLHRAEEFAGAGIGLALVHRIVSRHGGAVHAEGTVDGGATFGFSLPPFEEA